jgi:hypothetical protein
MELKLLDTKDALCLDGSPGAFWISENITQTDKWLIHFTGGGWC